MIENPNNRKPQRNREPKRADEAKYDPAGKFAWGEGDIIITKAKWSRAYDPGDGGVTLVQDLDELVLHLQQAHPDQPLQEALEAFLAAPDAKHMPAGLKAELEQAGLWR